MIFEHNVYPIIYLKNNSAGPDHIKSTKKIAIFNLTRNIHYVCIDDKKNNCLRYLSNIFNNLKLFLQI